MSGVRNVIVTCQECSTSFQLDDARIPATGARVRCSRCKHAFFLPNPSTSQSAAVDAVVEQVVEGQLGRAPEPTRDLAQAARAEPEEEDWQFSQEIRIAGDDDREEVEVAVARPTPPRPDSFDLTGDFGRGFDPETLVPDEAPRSGSAAAAPRAEPVRDESGFGSVADFSASIEDDDLSIDLATEPPSAPPPRAPARPSARRTAPIGSAAEDLGDPESWDIVGGEDARRATSRVAALIRPGASSHDPKPATTPRSKGLDLFAETELPPVQDDLEESRGRVEMPWAALGRCVGWGLTLVGVAAVFSLLIRPEWSRGDTEPQRLAIGPFVAETDRAGWLESSRSGLLLVFEGELRNTGATPLQPIPLQLSLFDRAGERLPDAQLAVGAPLDASTLREASPQVLAARRIEAASAWLSTPLAPGEVRRFLAVATADELPDTAWRVALEADRAMAR